MDSRPIRKEDELPEPCLHPSDDGKYDILYIYIQLSPHSTTPTPSPTPTRPSARHAYTSLCPTHAIFWSYSSGKLNDTPAFWRRSSRGCRCRCLRRGMRALGDFMEPLYSWRKKISHDARIFLQWFSLCRRSTSPISRCEKRGLLSICCHQHSAAPYIVALSRSLARVLTTAVGRSPIAIRYNADGPG